jgi:hypothetical protein
MQRLLQILTLLILIPTYLEAEPTQAIIYNGTGAPLEHKLASMTLAGIVNREEPRLYLLNVYETWSYNQTDESWRDIYQQEGNVVFTEISDFQQLVDHFENDINGAITYDPSLTYGNFQGQNFRWQAEVAAMLGGLTDCIPLPYTDTQTSIFRPDSVWVPDHFHGKDPIRVSAKFELPEHPWSNTDLNQEERYFLALDWALETLLDRTNPRKFYLREITDWAASQRMFQLNLAGTESLNFYSLSDEKAEKIETVMTYLRDSHPDEIFHVYGWMRPEPLVQWISGWGGSFHETLLSNLSWHHIFPADENYEYARPSAADPDEVELENKHYVLFIGSEGDAGNWVVGFQSGAWHSTARGEVPVGWGFNLHMFDQFPFLAQYYYNTATENDGFIAVTHPLGYAYSDMFPESFLPDAIEQSAELLNRYSIPSVYAYKHYNGAGVSTYRGVVISNNYDFNKLGSFAEATGTELTFLFDPALQTQRVYTQFGGLLYNHVNDETFYANVTDLNVAAQRITNKLSSQSTPNFLLAGYQRFRQDGTNVGGNNPADITIPRLKTLMDLIKSDSEIGDKVEFVTPERFTWLMQKSLEPTSVVNATDFQTQFHIYLNQAGNLQLNVSSDQVSRLMVRVFDISGKQLMEKHWGINTGDNSMSLPAGQLARGIYLVNLSVNNFSHTIKLVK